MIDLCSDDERHAAPPPKRARTSANPSPGIRDRQANGTGDLQVVQPVPQAVQQPEVHDEFEVFGAERARVCSE